MKKVYDETFDKGPHADDEVNAIMMLLNNYSHKPSEDEADLVNGDIGEESYSTIYDKKFRIVLYVQE